MCPCSDRRHRLGDVKLISPPICFDLQLRAPDRERFYGLGQHTTGSLDNANRTFPFQPENTEILVPVLHSSKEYVNNCVSCAMLGEWDVRPGVTEGRNPQGWTPPSPRGAGGRPGGLLYRSRRADVCILDFDFVQGTSC